MLPNLSQRERLLAVIAGVMLPMFVLLIGFLWFMNALGSYDSKIDEMKSGINQAKGLRTKALASERRRIRYLEHSLASAPEQARVQYRPWLEGLASEIFGADGYSLDSINSSAVRFDRSVIVAEKLSGKLTVPVADLGRLNHFLYRFYDAKILHRISLLTASPIVAKSGTAEELLPTGKIALSFQIEALGLADADKAKTISTESSAAMPRDLAAYRDKIETRNIFGLPNNPPQFSSSAEPSEFEGRAIELGISVREPDENDQLKFELVSSEIEGAKLVQRDAKSRSAQFITEALQPGTYKFKTRVTDSGFPPKSDEREFTLTVKPKEVIVTKPPEKFNHAQETVVVAIVQESNGVTKAWIRVRTLGRTHKLSVGETFDLDGASWKLVRIESDALTLEVNGKQQSYRIGDHLDRPRSATSIPGTSTAKDSSLGR